MHPPKQQLVSNLLLRCSQLASASTDTSLRLAKFSLVLPLPLLSDVVLQNMPLCDSFSCAHNSFITWNQSSYVLNTCCPSRHDCRAKSMLAIKLSWLQSVTAWWRKSSIIPEQCTHNQAITTSHTHTLQLISKSLVKCSNWLIDWLSMVLRLHQHNIGYTADGFYKSDDPTNSVKALKEGG